jgi:nitrogen regulatory protein PII
MTEDRMKNLEAIINPFDLDALRDSLSSIGVQGMTVSELRGPGRHQGRSHLYRGVEYADWLPQ